MMSWGKKIPYVLAKIDSILSLSLSLHLAISHQFPCVAYSGPEPTTLGHKGGKWQGRWYKECLPLFSWLPNTSFVLTHNTITNALKSNSLRAKKKTIFSLVIFSQLLCQSDNKWTDQRFIFFLNFVSIRAIRLCHKNGDIHEWVVWGQIHCLKVWKEDRYYSFENTTWFFLF